MNIKELNTGKSYDLHQGMQVEIERTNLFFNEWGEQSLPLDLPDTSRNRELTGYPLLLGGYRKPRAEIDCELSHGAFAMRCRQAVLSARMGEGITTSLYMNGGAFLSRIRDVQLADIYGDDIVPGVHTVQQGISFCEDLLDNDDPDFAIFPFLVDLGNGKHMVNKLERMDASGNVQYRPTADIGFYNAFERIEQGSDDGSQVIQPPGMYMTPFIRVASVLRRVFTYFGYELQDSFLTTLRPFSSMVFMNNTVDALLGGEILLQHLLPDCSVATLLDVFRKKFCLEFVPDEVNKTVSVLRFSEMLNSTPSADLTPYLVGWPQISFQEERQLRLSSENVVSESTAFDGVHLVAARYPEAWYNPNDGCYYHEGYTTCMVREKVADGTLPYYAGGPRQVYDVTVPDCQYCFSSYKEQVTETQSIPGVSLTYTRIALLGGSFGLFPYIGAGRALNSTVVPVAPSGEDDEVDAVSDAASLLPVLSFVWHDGTVPCGTNHTDGGWDYSLLYNGPYGIFERFWRDFDDCLRNAFHRISASLLLPLELKASLPAHQKVLLRGEALLPDVFRYTVGQGTDPVDSEFLTVTLRRDAQDETSSATDDSSAMVLSSPYTWEVEIDETEITQEDYEAVGYEFDYDAWTGEGQPRIIHRLPAIYPLPPTSAQYASGNTYYPRVTYRVTGSRSGVKFYRMDVSLRPVLSQSGGNPLIWPPRKYELI